MSAGRVWVLNLDAEQELAQPRAYTRSAHLEAIVARQAARLAPGLLQAGDVCLDARALAVQPALREVLAGRPGLAWCPTPSALALLRAAGVLPVPAPGTAVLREVNARPFAAALREPERGASFAKRIAHTLDDALQELARPAELGWLVRRTFGAAGRGRRRIAAGKPDAAELAWLVASLRLGPVVLEPWVQVQREYTRSAWLRSDGALVLSPPCVQQVDQHGAWTATQRAELDREVREDDAALAEMMERVGAALLRAGYFGPFGIDAYRHRAPGSSRSVLNPLSEINARFTMDWSTAMAHEPAKGEAARRIDAMLTSI